MSFNKELFQSHCEEIGGEYNSSEVREKTFHNCKINDKDKEPYESEGETRTLQWVENREGEDKASISVMGRGGASIKNPHRTEVSHPDEFAKRGAEDVGVPARKTLKVVSQAKEENDVRMQGTGEAR